MWWLASSFKKSDLVERLNVWGKTAVYTHNFTLNDGDQTEMIENFHAVLPGISVSILALALLIEAVDSANLSCLVIASEDSDVGRVAHLQTHEQLECLDRVKATVNIIAHKNVAGLRDPPTLVKQLEQVVELAVNVAHNGDWRANWLHV